MLWQIGVPSCKLLVSLSNCRFSSCRGHNLKQAFKIVVQPINIPSLRHSARKTSNMESVVQPGNRRLKQVVVGLIVFARDERKDIHAELLQMHSFRRVVWPLRHSSLKVRCKTIAGVLGDMRCRCEEKIEVDNVMSYP